MSPRTTLALLIVGVLAVLGGWYFGVAGTTDVTAPAPARLAFPGLAAKLAQAARVDIRHAGQTTTLARQGTGWVDTAQSGYPVQPAKLHAMLTALTELQLTERRTDDPAQLARLGLDDPDKPGSTAILLRVLDAAGAPIAALILGHQSMGSHAGLPEHLYARRPDQTQAWLAEGHLDVSDDPGAWVDHEIANIPTEQIATADVQQGDTRLSFGREAGKIVLTAPADHKPLDQYKLDDVFRAYEYLSFNAVKPAAQTPGTPAGTSVFTTTDGLHVHAAVFKDGQDVWARFTADGDGKAASQAHTLDARVKGWAYKIVAWKQNALAPTLDSLQADTPPPAAPAPVAPGSGAPGSGAPGSGAPGSGAPPGPMAAPAH
jgi:hypothetical protein